MTTIFLFISFIVGMQVGKFNTEQKYLHQYNEWKDTEDGRS